MNIKFNSCNLSFNGRAYYGFSEQEKTEIAKNIMSCPADIQKNISETLADIKTILEENTPKEDCYVIGFENSIKRRRFFSNLKVDKKKETRILRFSIEKVEPKNKDTSRINKVNFVYPYLNHENTYKKNSCLPSEVNPIMPYSKAQVLNYLDNLKTIVYDTYAKAGQNDKFVPNDIDSILKILG